MGTPQLWSFLGPMMTSRWLEPFVIRSQATPLSIKMPCVKDNLLKALGNVLRIADCRNRIRELSVRGNNRGLVALFDSYQDIPTTGHPSILRTLEILYLGQIHLRLPASITGCQHPHLSRLELHGCEFDWESPMFDSHIFTRLSFQVPHSNPPTLSRILAIAGIQDYLEEFELRAGAVPLFNNSTISHPIVNLRHLRWILLSGPLRGCLQFIRHVSYPRSSARTVLDLELDEMSEFGSVALPFVSTRYGHDRFRSDDNMPVIQHLVIHVTLFSTIVDIWDESRRMVPELHIVARKSPQQFVDARMILPIYVTLPIVYLRRFSVIGLSLTPEAWRWNVFDCMKMLEELELIDYDTPEPIIALNPDKRIDGSHDGAHSCIPLPNLRLLCIWDTGETIAMQLTREVLVHELRMCLKARKDADCGLKLLRLPGRNNIPRDEFDSEM